MPSWQAADPSVLHAAGASGSACGAATGQLCREVPDISADADPDFGQQSDTQLQFTDDVGSLGYSMYCATPNCWLLGDIVTGLLPISGLGGVVPSSPPPLPEGLAGWFPIGGTSLATPLLASAAVLWDQDADAHGMHGLGFLNPSLYSVASDPTAYGRDFFDVTTDSNDAQFDTSDCPTGCNTNHLYAAGVGYDMATGLGSVDVGTLGDDLVGQAAALTL